MSTDDSKKTKGPFVTRTPDQGLWTRVQHLASGSADSQLEAADIILTRTGELPQQADTLLIDLTKNGSLEFKRRVASALVNKPDITFGLESSLLEILSLESDEQIKKSVDDIDRPYLELLESLRQSALANLPNIKALAMPKIPQLDPQIVHMLNTIQNISIPSYLLDGLNNIRVVNESILRTMSVVLPSLPSYFPAEQRLQSATPTQHPLIARLKVILPGHDTWTEYQRLSRDILTFCLVPPLLDPLYEDTTENGIHRRDLIYHIPHEAEGFWAHLRNAYGALAIIVDSKNYAGPLPKDQIVVTSKYFGTKKLGNFGLIVTRQEVDQSGRKEQADRWVHHDEMIVCLSDADLEEMVTRKIEGERPAVVIDRQIRAIRQAI